MTIRDEEAAQAEGQPGKEAAQAEGGSREEGRQPRQRGAAGKRGGQG